MSDNDDNLTPEERGKTVAAEFVLGVLDANARREAQARLARDPAFAAEVAFWEERLAPLAASVTSVEPPLDAWARIQHAIDRADRSARESLWQSLAFWRPFGIGSAVLAAASIAALTFVALAPAPAPPMMAMLGGSGAGMPSFVAAVMPGEGSVMVMPASLLVGEQRALELWVIPPNDKPHSLGLIDRERAVKMTIPSVLMARLTGEAVLAVSLEPPGGSPTGQPTGPVVANGKLTSL